MQHIDEHYIVKAAARNLPAARLQLGRMPPLLQNTPVRWTAIAAPVSQDPDASAKPNVPIMSSATSASERKVFSAAYFLGDAPDLRSAFVSVLDPLYELKFA